MEFTMKIACSDSPSKSTFSIKNILNYQCEKDVVDFPQMTGEMFDYASCSIPRPIVVAEPLNPPPLMYPCASFGLPMYAPFNWTSIGMGNETLAWTPNNHFMTHKFFPAGYPPCTNLPRRRKLSTKKKKRPLFSQNQVQAMENEFTKNRYITETKRAELSKELNLTEAQVKTWFQNRRTKWRKELKGERETHTDI